MSSKIGKIEDQVLKQLELNPQKYANDITVDALVELLKQLSYYYYHTDEPIIPDATYDLLTEVLGERDPNNQFLQEVGAPISKNKVSLPYPMASLNKVKPTTHILEDWKKTHVGPYIISDKLDGVSGMLYKKDNKFRLFTRGDATSGQEITHLIPYLLKGKYKPGKIPNDTAIRGEIIISKSNFETIKDQFKNARNTVAGLVNSKNFSVELAKITDFNAYAIIHPVYKQQTQMEKLQEWEFPIVTFKVWTNAELTNKNLSEYFQERRNSSEYDIDGIVVMDDNTVPIATDKNPTHGFAFKMVLTDQVAEVKVIELEWSLTKYGYLKPVLKVEPVNLNGVTIQSVTAFNAKYVVDNNLGPGAVIKLVRSGDVIPHILAVLKPSTSGTPQLPDMPHKWNDTRIDFIAKDVHGEAKDIIIVKQLTHFFKVMDIKYISEGILKKLVDGGYRNLIDILNANIKKLAEIDGIGEKVITKIFDNTRIAFDTTNLETVMAASNVFGRGFGVRKLKVIINAYPNIMNEKWNDATLKEKLISLDGFEEKTATQFILYFAKFKHFFSILEKIKIISVGHLKYVAPPIGAVPIPVINTGILFKDMKVVFTGFRDKELEKLIEDNEGNITTTVSKNTNLLVYSESSSSKYTKAIELGIKTISKDDFIKQYKL